MTIPVENQRRQCRRRLHVTVAQPSRQLVSEPIAPRLRKRSCHPSPVRRCRRRGGWRGSQRRNRARSGGGRSRDTRFQLPTPSRPASARSASSTVLDRFVSGKSLPSSSSCSRTPSSRKKVRGPLGGERTQHVSHDARGTSPEVTLGHDSIRHVAARPSTDENLRSNPGRAVETSHVQIRRRALREDRRRQAGGACSDDDDSHGW